MMTANNSSICDHDDDDGDDDAAPVVASDYFDRVYEYIKQMLLEEDDLEYRPCMFQDCSALQAAEKYFYDALTTDHTADIINTSINHPSASLLGFNISGAGPKFWPHETQECPCSGEKLRFNGPPTLSCDFDTLVGSDRHDVGPFEVVGDGLMDKTGLELIGKQCGNGISPHHDPYMTKKKVHHGRGDNCVEERSSKLSGPAGYTSEEQVSSLQAGKYDKSLLCPKMNPRFYDESIANYSEESSGEGSEDETKKKQYRKTKEATMKRGRPKGNKKNIPVREVVDLRDLLTRCAEAVSAFNVSGSDQLLGQIRQHSSAYGNSDERLAHCFAAALEARMAGTGLSLYTAFSYKRTPAEQLLKSYRTHVVACPFKRMSNIYANKSIGKYTREASTVHIIDFGILYGFQWPCIIHGISMRPGGAPSLKITGIDFPQPGFKPAERVEQTGLRLAEFCRRFNVPFEYNAIAKRWEDIRIDDLKIERDEMLVVNCMYRLRHVLDEYAGVNSPRYAVLKLIKKINPRLFVHGVVNGAYNTPFFASRFREAMFHYSSAFDMLEATLPREDQDRLMYEKEVFGRDVMNVVACEGSGRVERPEAYKQWQVRNTRAGFGQLDLNREIMKEVKIKVRRDYHKEFLLDEDGGWMLQGWKGRVMYALSCWKPKEE
ncbi:hypothetical protein OROGR_006475 [Orobanche gracilis]